LFDFINNSKELLKMLILRTTPANLISRNNFQWPAYGPVECQDWSDKPECGNGLHGLPWGEGYCSAFKSYLDSGGVAQVIEAQDNEVVPLENNTKCKFRRGVVVFTGSLDAAIAYVRSHGGEGKAIAHAKVIVGDNRTATAGYRGTATAGEYGTATAGEYGTATAGEYGTATAGEYGTATAGNGGAATAGNGGTATAGNGGAATAGNGGTATAGNGGAATAGEYGTIEIASYDFNANRYRRSVGYVGEGGILPNVKYKLDANGLFISADASVMIAPAQAIIAVGVAQPAATPAAPLSKTPKPLRKKRQVAKKKIAKPQAKKATRRKAA
jgi:hypothetical protein